MTDGTKLTGTMGRTKLDYLEKLLGVFGIDTTVSRGCHLFVESKHYERAAKILTAIDDIDEDDPMFEYTDDIGVYFSGKLTLALTYCDNEDNYFVVISDGEDVTVTFVGAPVMAGARDMPEQYRQAAHAAISFCNEADQEWVQDGADTAPPDFGEFEGCWCDHWLIADSKEALHRAYDAVSGGE